MGRAKLRRSESINWRSSNLRLEPLEQRHLLSATSPVTDAFVAAAPVSVEVPHGAFLAGMDELRINFSADVQGAAEEQNYSLVAAGPDALLRTADDLTVDFGVQLHGRQAQLTMTGLDADLYRLTVRDTILGASREPIDGDG